MNIGIIDSGLEKDFIIKNRARPAAFARVAVRHRNGRHFLERCEYSQADIRRDLAQAVGTTIFTDETGHGTKMAELIHRSYSKGRFIVCKIFEDSVQTQDECFIAALKWMIGRRPGLINLSLGSFDLRKQGVFRDLADQARRQGVTLCCAGYEKPSYPALLDNVISVINEKTYAAFPGLDETVRNSVDIVVRDSLIGGVIATTSEACALFTGLLARYGRKRLPAEHLRELTGRLRSLPTVR